MFSSAFSIGSVSISHRILSARQGHHALFLLRRGLSESFLRQHPLLKPEECAFLRRSGLQQELARLRQTLLLGRQRVDSACRIVGGIAEPQERAARLLPFQRHRLRDLVQRLQPIGDPLDLDLGTRHLRGQVADLSRELAQGRIVGLISDTTHLPRELARRQRPGFEFGHRLRQSPAALGDAAHCGTHLAELAHRDLQLRLQAVERLLLLEELVFEPELDALPLRARQLEVAFFERGNARDLAIERIFSLSISPAAAAAFLPAVRNAEPSPATMATTVPITAPPGPNAPSSCGACCANARMALVPTRH